MQIRDLLEDFGHYLKYERRLSENTYSAYLSDLAMFVDYLMDTYNLENVDEVAWLHIRSYFVELSLEDYKTTSLQRKQSAVNQFFDFAVFKGILKKNPVRKFPKRKKEQQLPVSLNEEQTKKLFEEHKMESDLSDIKIMGDWLILEMLYLTGMRVSELTQLKAQHIDRLKKEISVLGKGNKWRVIPIEKHLIDLIDKYISLKEKESWGLSEYLLTLKSGKPLYRQYVYRVVKKYLGEVSLASYKGPHVLRHTFASQLLNAGANLMHIKELLGHENLESTQIYTQIQIERLKEVYKQAHPKS